MKAQEKGGMRAPAAAATPTKVTKPRKPASGKRGGKATAKVINNEDGDSADSQVSGDSQRGEANGEDDNNAKVKDEMNTDADAGRNGADENCESSKEQENSGDDA
jgi:hypothetical protein